jgi:hypothetical protein
MELPHHDENTVSIGEGEPWRKQRAEQRTRKQPWECRAYTFRAEGERFRGQEAERESVYDPEVKGRPRLIRGASKLEIRRGG